LAAARRACELEPGTLSYAINLGYILLELNKTEEARALATRIVAEAKNPMELHTAESFQRSVEGREGRSARMGTPGDGQDEDDEPLVLRKRVIETKVTPENSNTTSGKSNDASSARASAATASVPPADSTAASPVRVTQGRAYEMTGKITVLDCTQAPEVTMTIALSSIEMKLHAQDAAKVEMASRPGNKKAATPGCAAWKGRNAKVSYHLTPGTNFDGEIISIQFF
jgi:hypothetical protein